MVLMEIKNKNRTQTKQTCFRALKGSTRACTHTHTEAHTHTHRVKAQICQSLGRFTNRNPNDGLQRPKARSFAVKVRSWV